MKGVLKMLMSEQLIKDFGRYLKSKKKSKNTIISYTTDLNSFYNYLESIDNTDLSLVTQKDIDTYIIEQMDTNSAATVTRRITSIDRFYQYLIRFEIVANNPTQGVERPKLEKRLPSCLTLKQAQKLLNYIKVHGNRRDFNII